MPEWARREWGSPRDTAERIERLPAELAEVATAQWYDACSELARTPAGRGLRTQVIQTFNTKLRKALESAETLTLYGVSASSTGSDVQNAARDLADHAFGLLLGPAGNGGWKSFARKRGLDPQDPADRLRAKDPAYWRRQIRTTVWRARERMWLILAPEMIEEWCSVDCYRSWAEDQNQQAKWAQKQLLIGRDLDQYYDQEEGVNFQVEGGKTGAEVALSEMLSGRERRQFARLMTVSSGLQELAVDEGLDPYFITITPPAHQHPSTTAGGQGRRANPYWDGSDARDQHALMCKQWRGCRVALSRIGRADGEKRGVEGKYWIRSVQPQKGGDAHWHMVMWARNIEAVEDTIRRSFRAEESDGIARYQHGVVIERVENGVHGVMSYLARALGYLLRSLGPDATDKDVIEARRTAAWARTYGIRRFQASHTAATLWDMIYSGAINLGEDNSAQQAVTGEEKDFAAFYKEVKEGQGLRPAYIQTQTRYGEPSTKCIGIKSAQGTTWVKTRTWTMETQKADIDGLVAVVHINQDKRESAREERQADGQNNRARAGEGVGGSPPPPSGGPNKSAASYRRADRENPAPPAGWREYVEECAKAEVLGLPLPAPHWSIPVHEPYDDSAWPRDGEDGDHRGAREDATGNRLARA